MPAGALRTLRYSPCIAGGILAYWYAERLRADRFVQNVEVRITKDSFMVLIQFHDDQNEPYDSDLRQKVEDWIPCDRPIEPLSRYKRVLKGF